MDQENPGNTLYVNNLYEKITHDGTCVFSGDESDMNTNHMSGVFCRFDASFALHVPAIWHYSRYYSSKDV